MWHDFLSSDFNKTDVVAERQPYTCSLFNNSPDQKSHAPAHNFLT